MRKRCQVIERSKDAFLVRIYLGEDETGRSRYYNKTITGTKRDAQKHLTSVLGDLDRGTFVEPSTETLNSYLDRWLENSAAPRVRARTLRDYRSLLERYVRPVMGQRILASITPLDVQSVYTGMLESGLSPRTIRYTHAILSSALKQAVRWQLLPKNVAEYVDLPRQKRTEMHAMSRDEAAQFLKAAKDDQWYTLFLLAVTTGMRPGECLALQWKGCRPGRWLSARRQELDKAQRQVEFRRAKDSKEPAEDKARPFCGASPQGAQEQAGGGPAQSWYQVSELGPSVHCGEWPALGPSQPDQPPLQARP